MGVIHSLQMDAWREFCWSARKLKGTKEEEEEVEELEEGSEGGSEESEDEDYEPSEGSEEEVGLGPEVEEEPEMEVREDTPPPPESVLESGSEAWDLNLRM